MYNESPLIAEIDNESEIIIADLKTMDERVREQERRLSEAEGYISSVKDYDLRSQWEDNCKRLGILFKEDKALTTLMNNIRTLYQQKKKHKLANQECPPEIVSKLIDKVMDYKREKIRYKGELEDIEEEFIELKKAISGNVGANSGKNKKVDDDDYTRSRFMTQLKYISPESLRKKPKEFLDYLTNYEAELAKSLAHSTPGTIDFKNRMIELGKVTDMKKVFMEAQRKEEDRTLRGYDISAVMGESRKQQELSGVMKSAGLTKLHLENMELERETGHLNKNDEELVRLQNKISKMNETIRGLDQLNKEKEKLALLQREKYEALERERYEVEILKLKAEREKEESDHLKRLQKMNMELDYIDQLKSKTVNIVSQQLEEFGKIEEKRWASKRMRDKEFHQEELNRLQAEYLRREERRQLEFDRQMKDIEGKYSKALKMIEDQSIDPITLKMLVGKERQINFMKEMGKGPIPESDYSDYDSEYGNNRFKKDMKGVMNKHSKRPEYKLKKRQKR